MLLVYVLPRLIIKPHRLLKFSPGRRALALSLDVSLPVAAALAPTLTLVPTHVPGALDRSLPQ